MSELKPCPFCGGASHFGCHGNLHLPDDYFEYYIRCSECEVTSQVIPCHRDGSSDICERLSKSWNTRASEAREADLKAKLEKARTALRNLRNECSGKPRTDMLLQLIKEADEALP